MFWWFLGSNAVNCPELYPEKTCFRIFPQINPSLPSFLASLCIQRYTLNSKRTWKSSFLGIWSIPFGAFSAYFSRGANWLLVSGSASKLESWSDDEAKNSVASLGPIFVFFWISCIQKKSRISSILSMVDEKDEKCWVIWVSQFRCSIFQREGTNCWHSSTVGINN